MNKQHPLISRKQELDEETINSSTQEFQTMNESTDNNEVYDIKVVQRNDVALIQRQKE